jgi:hypothetical protein
MRVAHATGSGGRVAFPLSLAWGVVFNAREVESDIRFRLMWILLHFLYGPRLELAQRSQAPPGSEHGSLAVLI